MMRIGILSDTHGYIAPQVYSFFKDCDELWHAGDIGPEVLDTLRKFKPVVAVYGNIDDWTIRAEVPSIQCFERENQRVLMTHIGGYPKHYAPKIPALIRSYQPQLFIAGHSHILKVMYDQDHELLHINPGAAGRSGFHQKCTLVRFTLDHTPKDLEIMEYPKFTKVDNG